MHILYLVAVFLIIMYSPCDAQFKKGMVIDQYGATYPGLLKVNDGSDILLYKANKRSATEKVTVNELRGFQIENDSFLIVKNYHLLAESVTLNGFAKVILKGDSSILCRFIEFRDPKYPSTATMTAGPAISIGLSTQTKIIHYLVFRDDRIGLISEYNFYREMPLIVAQCGQLKNEITSKRLKFKDMEEIAAEYEWCRMRHR
jgi:hypothetical protein